MFQTADIAGSSAAPTPIAAQRRCAGLSPTATMIADRTDTEPSSTAPAVRQQELG